MPRVVYRECRRSVEAKQDLGLGFRGLGFRVWGLGVRGLGLGLDILSII
jgi:hypothetical protein